jgi:hypothetical protein
METSSEVAESPEQRTSLLSSSPSKKGGGLLFGKIGRYKEKIWLPPQIRDIGRQHVELKLIM